MKLRHLLIAAVAPLLAVTACSSSSGDPGAGQSTGLNPQTQVGPYQGVGLVNPYPRPSFTLTDTKGRTYNFAQQTDGKPTMLFFGYTTCPDVCPATMADIGNALRSLPKSTQQKVTVVFVTTDIKTDTAAKIQQWINLFSPGSTADFVGLRGSQAQIDAAQAASHILIAEDNGKTHSSQVLLYGKDNYAHVSFVYNDSQEQKQMEHDIPLVVNA